MDLPGFTFSLGRETETMGVNLGFECVFGFGHTLGYLHDGDGRITRGKTSCHRELFLVSLSTFYHF